MKRSPGRRRRKPIHGLQLSVPLILRWCDAHHRRTGEWPKIYSGWIKEAPSLTWSTIRDALYHGSYGLKGGSSLRLLLCKRRGLTYDRRFVRGRRLTIGKIREWAREHHERTGMWPSPGHGLIPGSGGETWNGIESALNGGYRGLPAGRSLARLLRKRSRSGRRLCRRPLTIREILQWAREYRERRGTWPISTSGPIPGSRGETWQAVHGALRHGGRGLRRRRLTLARLLARDLGVPLPTRGTKPLTIRQILAWADEHYRRKGTWPKASSGRILAEPKERWSAINSALKRGSYGLPGGSSLPRLLAQHRGRRHVRELSPLSLARILDWADAHHERTGRWPTSQSGAIPEAPDPGETWSRVSHALFKNLRGLGSGPTLAGLLAKRRGVLRGVNKPPLTEARILAWAEAYRRRHRRYPIISSGIVDASRCDTWSTINSALANGSRGLPGGTTLAGLLARRRGVLRGPYLPRLREQQVIAWAESHYRRHGRFPSQSSGRVAESPKENWAAINAALTNGHRGFPGGTTLHRLLTGWAASNKKRVGPFTRLTRAKIMLWARAYYRRRGAWPGPYSGKVLDAPGETWFGIEQALRKEARGLSGSSSLKSLLATQHKPRRRRSVAPGRSRWRIA